MVKQVVCLVFYIFTQYNNNDLLMQIYIAVCDFISNSSTLYHHSSKIVMFYLVLHSRIITYG